MYLASTCISDTYREKHQKVIVITGHNTTITSNCRVYNNMYASSTFTHFGQYVGQCDGLPQLVQPIT